MNTYKKRRRKEYLSVAFNIPTLLIDLKKSIWFIISLSISASLLAYIVKDLSYKPVYRVETSYYVTSRGINNDLLSNMSTAQSMAKRYSEIFTSSIIRKKVKEELDLESGEFIISAEVVDETNIVVVRTTADTPELAFRIMQIIVENYPGLSKYLVTDAIINNLTSLTVPRNQTYDLDLKKTMAKAFVMATIALFALVIIFSCFKDTIRIGKDVEQKLDSRYLGEIGFEKKRKKNKRTESMLITKQSISFRYVESIGKICRKVINIMNRYNAKTLLITSCLENEGKSTVAANIALAMAEQGKNVLIIDLDLIKPAQHIIFNVSNQGNFKLEELLNGEYQLKQSICTIGDPNISAILNNKSIENSTELLSNGVLKRHLETLKEKYDIIIIDSPPVSASADAETIASIADGYLVVVREHIATAKKINDVLDILYECPGHTIGCVVNAVHNSYTQGIGGRSFERDYFYGYGNYK